MNRRNEWMGFLAVIVFIAALLAYQFWPANNAPESAVQRDSIEAVDATDSETGAFEANVVYDWVIDVDDLPDEAFDTLVLIDSDGPFPYSKDGSTFQNREGLLPQQSRNHYQEFTVDTPGSSDRGARRIVAGADGELFWTDDHYGSFAQIVGWD